MALRTWALTLAANVCTTLAINASAFAPDDIITRDVAIIGGGASGTYAAVRLREDYNTSIVVVEVRDKLGGHVNTYYDPVSNTSIDYGVLAYLSYHNASAFFHRFNIPTTTYASSAINTSITVSVENGALLTNYVPPSLNDTIAAIEAWNTLCAKYASYLVPGMWDFPQPEDIPAELLVPFSETAEKYNLQPLVPELTEVSNVGVGGVGEVLTMYVMIAFGYPVTQGFLEDPLFMPVGYPNQELYNRALNLLRKDVLLQSWVTDSQRTNSSVELVVESADGCKKLIKAKRLLFSAQPSLSRFEPFHPDTQEESVFEKWTPTWSLVGIAKIPGLPSNYSISYVSPEIVPANYLDERNWPWTLLMTSSGPDAEHLFSVRFATNYSVSHAEAKATIQQAVTTLSTGGTFPGANTTIDWLEFGDHNSVLWRQPASEIKAGFVQKLYGLQGHLSTWYTGGLWTEDYTGTVWAFTDTVLPRLLKSLR